MNKELELLIEERDILNKKIRQIKNKIRYETNKNDPNFIKKNRISSWKNTLGITNITDEVYDKYINTIKCEKCSVLLTSGGKNMGKNTKCLYSKDKLFVGIYCSWCITKETEFYNK